MPRITALTPSKRDPSRLVIQVDGKSVATLSRKQVEAMSIGIDGPWSEILAAKVADAVALESAFDQAMRMLNRRPMSKAKLAGKLRERGHDAAMVERIVARLLSIGALNDESLARELLDEIGRTRPAGPGMKRAKLAQRGVDDELIETLLETDAKPGSQLEDARRLIASRARAMAKLDETTRKRRLWGLLARRGFDEETIAAVLGAVEE